MKTIGLCMIVKNEARVILRCLESARPLIEYVLIEDTGSTDGTQDLIRDYLKREGLPGKVFDEPWRDFAYNRSLALARLREKNEIDYALVMDADDVLVYDDGFDAAPFKENLTADLYLVELHHGVTRHHRPQICSNRLEFRYRGIVHEFLEGPKGAIAATARGFHINPGVEGARSQDPDKYRKDALVLEKALETEEDPFLRSRYRFYMAQSWRDAGENEKALAGYLARAELGYWKEEIFVSLYNAARLKETLNHPDYEIIGMYLRAYEICPHRAESLHGAARYCRLAGKFHQGYMIAKQGAAISQPTSGLFIEPWIYNYGLLDELAINAYWIQHYDECLDICERLLKEEKIPKSMHKRIQANANFALEQLNSRVRFTSIKREHKGRFAIVTPYYREERPILERCIDSVRNQTMAEVDHILVADGYPQDWIDKLAVRHIKLDCSHNDYGNTPRAVGCLCAVAEGYDGIGLLDADAWLEKQHVDACLEAADKACGKCDYVIAKRTLRRIDGSVLPVADEPSERFVDTNCFFFLPGSYHLLPVWALMPRELTIIGDRVFYLAMRSARLWAALVDKVTVNYLCLWDSVYLSLGESPPGSKPNPDNRGLLNWTTSRSIEEKNMIKKRLGIDIEILYFPAYWPELRLHVTGSDVRIEPI